MPLIPSFFQHRYFNLSIGSGWQLEFYYYAADGDIDSISSPLMPRHFAL